MLTVFDRYLLRTVFITTLVALIFLLTVDFIIQTSGDADNLGKAHFTLSVLLAKHLLNLPDKVIVFTPAAILIGTMMGLGQLSGQHEITVIRAVGVSRIRLVSAIILLAFLFGLFNLANSEWIAPNWNAQSKLLYDHALGRSSDLTTKQGIWLQQQNTIIHIAGLNADGTLQGLRFFKITQNTIEITEAEHARYQGTGWQLYHPRSYRTNNESSQNIPAPAFWQSNISPTNLQQFAAVRAADTIAELWTVIRFMQANGINHRQESLKLWQRILTPFTTIAMVLLALPFAFSHSRSTQQGKRLVIGILLGVAYYVIHGVITNLTLLLGWTPILGAGLPVILFALPPLILLQRQ